MNIDALHKSYEVTELDDGCILKCRTCARRWWLGYVRYDPDTGERVLVLADDPRYNLLALLEHAASH
jgi:hypothetical protein